MFFLDIPYKLISFLIIYKAFLAYLFIGVYFYTKVTIGVIGGTWLVQVLLAVTAVYKVNI